MGAIATATRTCLLLILLLLVSIAQDARSLFIAAGRSLDAGRCAEASDQLLQAMRIFESDPTPPPEQIAAVWHSLGTAYRCRKLYSKAEQAYRTALELGPLPRDSEVLASLASVYTHFGRDRDGLNALQRAEQLLQARGHPDPETLGLLLNNRSAVESRLGREQDAEESIRRALEVLQSATDPDLVLLVYLKSNAAELFAARKDFREAADLCTSALAPASAAKVPPARRAALEDQCASYLRHAGQTRESSRLKAHAKALRASQPGEPSDDFVVDAADLVRRTIK